jgi:hypothetical protein
VASGAFTYFENLHFQYQQGLITEEEWISTKQNLAAAFEYSCIHAWWGQYGGNFRKSFAKEVEGVIQGMQIASCAESF